MAKNTIIQLDTYTLTTELQDSNSLIAKKQRILLLEREITIEAYEEWQELLCELKYQRELIELELVHEEYYYERALERAQVLKQELEAERRRLHNHHVEPALQSLLADLLAAVTKLIFELSFFIAARKTIHLEWQQLHLTEANRLLKYFLNPNNKVALLNPEGKAVKLTNEKREHIRQALIPAPPSLLCQHIPELAKLVLENKKAHEANPIGENILKRNDVLGELRMMALMHNSQNEERRLTGPRLLHAIHNNRPSLYLAKKAQPKEERANTKTALTRALEKDIENMQQLNELTNKLHVLSLAYAKMNPSMQNQKQPEPVKHDLPAAFSTKTPFRTRLTVK